MRPLDPSALWTGIIIDQIFGDSLEAIRRIDAAEVKTASRKEAVNWTVFQAKKVISLYAPAKGRSDSKLA